MVLEQSSAAVSAFVAPPVAINAFGLAWMKAQPCPQVIVTPELEVQWANNAAHALMELGPDLGLKDGCLVVRDEIRTLGLIDFLKRERTAGQAWVFKRLGAEGYFAVRCDQVDCIEAPLAYALSFVATADHDRYVWSDIKAVFGLTRSETELVKRLIGGKPIQAAAADMGVTVDTARTHIRNVYGKLGISSREQLFATVLPFRMG